MKEKFKITGFDIVRTDGEDHTGALKELGYEYSYTRENYGKIYNIDFDVDIDFCIKHGITNYFIAQKYKETEDYKKYFDEGKLAYLNGLERNNPYNKKTIKDSDYWENHHAFKAIPWFDGYDETKKEFNYKKYKIDEFKKEILMLVKRYGFDVEYEDEYNMPFLITKDGYSFNFIDSPEK